MITRPRFPKSLFRDVRRWSETELDEVIFALERDSLSTPSDIASYLSSKSHMDVSRLFESLLRATDEEIAAGNAFNDTRQSKCESTIDVIQNTIHSIIPNVYSFDEGISAALLDESFKASQLGVVSECSGFYRVGSICKSFVSPRGPDYSRIYQFLSSLFKKVKPMTLTRTDSAVIIDAITCLVELTQRTIAEAPSDPLFTHLLDSTIDKISSLSAVLASFRNHYNIFRSAVKRTSEDTIRKSLYTLPAALTLLVSEDQRFPAELATNREFGTKLINQFAACWNLPSFSEDSTLEQLHDGVFNFVSDPLGLSLQSRIPCVIDRALASSYLLHGFYTKTLKRYFPMLSTKLRPLQTVPKRPLPALELNSKLPVKKRRIPIECQTKFRRFTEQIPLREIDSLICHKTVEFAPDPFANVTRTTILSRK